MFQLKTLTQNDESSICAYLHEIDSIFPVPMSSRMNIEEYTKKLLKYGVVIAAEDDGKIVGICMGYANDEAYGRAYLGTLGVSERYRSLGVGSELIDAMLVFARNRKMKYIGLHAHRDNLGAIRFYQRKGFVLSEDSHKPYEEAVYFTQTL